MIHPQLANAAHQTGEREREIDRERERGTLSVLFL